MTNTSIWGFLTSLEDLAYCAAPLLARAPIQPTSESGLLKAYYSSESSAQLIFHNLLPQMVPLLRGLGDYFYENWLTPESIINTCCVIFRYNWALLQYYPYFLQNCLIHLLVQNVFDPVQFFFNAVKHFWPCSLCKISTVVNLIHTANIYNMNPIMLN